VSSPVQRFVLHDLDADDRGQRADRDQREKADRGVLRQRPGDDRRSTESRHRWPISN
jgi:hypothetical protein